MPPQAAITPLQTTLIVFGVLFGLVLAAWLAVFYPLCPPTRVELGHGWLSVLAERHPLRLHGVKVVPVINDSPS